MADTSDIEALEDKRWHEECVIASKRAALCKAKSKHKEAQALKLRELKQAIRDAKRSNNTISQRREAINLQIEDLRVRKVDAEARIRHLSEENKVIRSWIFNGVCPECGGRYEGAKRAEMLRRFNAKKEAALAANISEDESVKSLYKDLDARITAAKKELAEIRWVNTNKMEKELYEYRKSMRPFDGSELEAEIARLEAERTIIPEVNDNRDTTETE